MEDFSHAESETHWAVSDARQLYWESWGNQHAIFDARSGETHLLPELTARLLQRLSAGAATAGVLAEQCCTESGEACSGEFVAQITQLLIQLHDVGLIEKDAT